MASWFSLVLQTQPPIVEIIMPPYCAADEVVNIVIQANVPLGSYQSISMTDCNGVTSDLIFLYEDGKFYGQVIFDSQDGFVTFDFGMFKDEVDNESESFTRTLQVFLSEVLMIDLAMFNRTVTMSTLTRGIEFTNIERLIDTNSLTQSISTEMSTREIDCGVIVW